MKIGVFDSGKGGTTILEAIKKKLPNEEYMYIGDSKNCPYGEKTDEELFRIVDGITERLLNFGAEIIVIACNTATTRCIKHLREKYPQVAFVGTEPAIKLALKKSDEKILVMATPGTAKSERLLLMIDENNAAHRIDILACPGLADAVERNEGIDEVLHKLLDETSQDYGVVVLGCTHYSLIKNQIQQFFPHAELVDGNEGVANRVEKVLKEKTEH